MRTLPRLGAMIATAALLATPLLAATAWGQQAPASTQNPTVGATADTSTTPPGGPGDAGTSTDSTTPHMTVATVRMDGGWRASKFIGSTVYDDQNQRIGTVDDLVMSGKDKVAVAVLSVGGFLGMGNKLVAVPFDHLNYDPASKDQKVVLQGASKDTLSKMPGFIYGNTAG